MSKKLFEVLLYYKYTDIKYPKREMKWQRSLCEKLQLTGRIIVAKEGINGTVEGTIEATQKYIDEMVKRSEYSDIDFKRSSSDGEAFPKLSVKVRPEIVSAYMPELNPNLVTGKYITAEELHEWFEEGKEFYIVDMRNDYEYASGYFENSLFSGFSNFRELETAVEKLQHLKNKTIVTVCTGGVRCEKASGYLVANDFNDVYQLHNGIQTYMEQYPNQHFKGKLYVFDGRITIGFNTDSPEHEVVGKCILCESASDHYVNCGNNACHKHCIICEECKDSKTGLYFCSDDCKKLYQADSSITTNNI